MRNDLPVEESPPAGLREIIARADPQGEPRVEIIKPVARTGPRVGVFASSFNPITVAHIELMRRARDAFLLAEVLALAGRANADKRSYECSLEDRLRMLLLALRDDAHLAVGLSSHAFYVD